MDNKTKPEVANLVREAIMTVPAFDNMRLDVDEKHIYATEVGGTTWWRVPVVPTPMPRLRSYIYEALAEVEVYLQAEQDLDIILFVAAAEEVDADEKEPVLHPV